MPFYSDLGPEYPRKYVDTDNSNVVMVDRYAFWELEPWKSKHGVVETANELDALIEKYGEHRLVNVKQ